jgi:hypothetical protein
MKTANQYLVLFVCEMCSSAYQLALNYAAWQEWQTSCIKPTANSKHQQKRRKWQDSTLKMTHSGRSADK